jgi:AbrB family looped-hinge helix DNA binding protein
MRLAQSRLTAQGQVSVPAAVRRRLDLQPGSVLEWDAEGDRVVIRRAGQHSLEEIHSVLFPGGAPKARTLQELKDGLLRHGKERHARR